MQPLTNDEWLAIEREYCRRSLANFAKEAWHVLEPATALKWGWALDAMCEHLEAVSNGEILSLLMNVPPGTMKSLLTGVVFPAWEWGPRGRSDLRYLGTSHKQDLAVRDNLKCRRLIQSKWYQDRWPVTLTTDQNAKTKFENDRTGFREAMAFTSMTGSRGDRCLVGSTKIITDMGIKSIQDIVLSAQTCNVFSYDENSKRVVQRPIEAVARRAPSRVYRVHLASGWTVDCTPDHRWYTQRGYVETSLLSETDAILRSVQCGICKDGGGGKKTLARSNVLQPIMLDNVFQCEGWEGGAVLQRLRIEDDESSRVKAVLGRLSGNSPRPVAKNHRKPSCKYTGHAMRGVWGSRSTAGEDEQTEVLLCAMQECGAFKVDAGGKQSRLARRSGSGQIPAGCVGGIQQGSPRDNQSGRRGLCGLPFTQRVVGPSPRYGRSEQSDEKSGNSLSRVPHHCSCGREIETTFDAVAMVEDLCREEVVYDIQVAGTRNFFANGLLSHNCILDDPLSVDDANSEAALHAAEITFTEALPTRLNNETSAKIVIMQRLNERDTSGIILAKKLDYVHLCLPMEFEPERRCHTAIGFTDPRTEDGELLFPERFGRKQVDDLKATMGSYAVAGQLQQRPAPREGGLFKRSWFNVVRALPAGTQFVRGWDLAASTGQTSAYTAGVKIGRSPDGRFVIANAVRDKLSAGGVRTLIKNTASQDGTDVRVSIPQDPGQAGKAQSQDIVRDLAGFNAHASPESGDKVTRADPLAAQAEAGNVDILFGDWNEAFLDEAANFPNGAYLDQIDAASRAFNELAKKRGGAPLFGTYGTSQ